MLRTGPDKVKTPILDKSQVASEGLKDGPGHHTQRLNAAELSDNGLLGAALPSVSYLPTRGGVQVLVWDPITSQVSN